MSMQGLPGHVPSAARGFLLALSPPTDLWQEWPGVPASECVPVSGPVPRDPLQVCFVTVVGGQFFFMSVSVRVHFWQL